MLKDLGVQIPSFLVIIVCSILAIARWQRHPRVSLLVLIGLLLLLIHEFVFSFIYAAVPDLIISSATDLNRDLVTRNVFIGLAVSYNCLETVPFILLLIAAFMSRRKADTVVA